MDTGPPGGTSNGKPAPAQTALGRTEGGTVRERFGFVAAQGLTSVVTWGTRGWP
jgi:hypothetical protein